MSKIFKPSTSFLRIRFSETVLKSYSSDELRRFELVNFICTISIINSLIYIPVYYFISFTLLKPAIYYLFISSLIFSGIILLNKNGFHKTSRILTAILEPLIMSYVVVVFFGKAPGFQVYLLVASIIPLFLWSVKEKTYLFGFIGYCLLLYILLEFVPFRFEPKVILPEHISYLFRSTNILICFLGIGVALSIYQILYNKNEKIVIAQKEELKLAQAHKDKIYSIIAHDLRGPISAFVGLTDTFIENYDTSNDQSKKKALTVINVTSVSLFNLLENLLEWTKMQSGMLSIRTVNFQLIKVINEAISVHKILIKQKKQNILVHVDNTLTVKADRHMVSTIIRNLISNALKYTSLNGEISISAIKNAETVSICVSDNGQGISEENQECLFLREKDIKNNANITNQSSGLGLLVCKEFIELNKGEIRVESAKGHGSSFYFTLASGDKLI